MLKRPLNPRFADAVLTGLKTTTIREKPWPLQKPIMLFRWQTTPYRSKQIDIAAVIASSVQPIRITRNHDSTMAYQVASGDGQTAADSLWQSEGFESQDDMDHWFRTLLEPGHCLYHHLMRFSLLPVS